MVDAVQFQPVRGPSGLRTVPSSGPAARPAFSTHLERAVRNTGKIAFSAHAAYRLRERGIELSETDLARLAKAVDSAQAKGARETLLIMDSLALVVSVPNRTVITAIEPDGDDDAVFTNIDSAVVVATANASTETESGPDPIWGGPVAAD